MVTAHLVKQLPEGSEIYVIGNDLTGHGLAYGTRNTHHLLNVPAAKMGAFPDKVDDFYHWLSTAQGALAKQRLKLTENYAAMDFVPRALYAEYLSDIWRSTQENAAQHGCNIKLVESTATRIRNDGDTLAVLTARGDAIAVDKVALATGNELKAALPNVSSAQIIQSPWQGSFDGAKEWASPVVLIGAGLTGVDTVIALRDAGYAGEIIAVSRHGHWPASHGASGDIAYDDTAQNLSALLRFVRSNGAKWRGAIDSLRPHTIALWQKFSLREQTRFFAQLFSTWNTHRHRMASQIASQIATDKKLQLRAVKKLEARVVENALQLKLDGEAVTPSRVINCMGGELNILRSMNPLLKQALADDMLEPHANGAGIAVDPHYRAWGAAHPRVYVIGSLMTGQLLESTAVPELRVQAAQVAKQLTLD